MKTIAMIVSYFASLAAVICLTLVLAYRLMMAGMVWQPILILAAGLFATMRVSNVKVSVKDQ